MVHGNVAVTHTGVTRVGDARVGDARIPVYRSGIP